MGSFTCLSQRRLCARKYEMRILRVHAGGKMCKDQPQLSLCQATGQNPLRRLWCSLSLGLMRKPSIAMGI